MLVASITASRPLARRDSRALLSTLNAAFVAAWFASSPDTIARKRSDDRISSGAKWRAANVDLPAPAAPTRTTRLGSAMTISAIAG